MKSNQVIVTSGNTPLVIPMDDRGGPRSIGTTPAGAGNYTVEFTMTPQQDGLTNNTFPIADMTTATTAESAELGSITAIVVTLHSGTSVTVDISQSDV